LVNGVIGPRGDGYAVGQTMTADEGARYHALQARAFGQAGADLITAVTMTYADEAVGIVRAAAAAGLPVVVSFTVETDGRLPSGETLVEAVTAVDESADGAGIPRPEFYMINCAHPSHFVDVLEVNAGWTARIGAVRANASRMSHDELDNAAELDRGDVNELAADYRHLRSLLPNLMLVGGCCGTDHSHVAAIVARLVD
jgi:homocysteine S-methyltransferase